MHTSYEPEEITEDYIENVCDDLRCALINVLDNDGAEEEYDSAIDELRHIDAMLDAMVPSIDDV
jgi:hypothetical protein